MVRTIDLSRLLTGSQQSGWTGGSPSVLHAVSSWPLLGRFILRSSCGTRGNPMTSGRRSRDSTSSRMLLCITRPGCSSWPCTRRSMRHTLISITVSRAATPGYTTLPQRTRWLRSVARNSPCSPSLVGSCTMILCADPSLCRGASPWVMPFQPSCTRMLVTRHVMSLDFTLSY
jgi:hypothetical protein